MQGLLGRKALVLFGSYRGLTESQELLAAILCPHVNGVDISKERIGAESHHRSPGSSQTSGQVYSWAFWLHESINYLYYLSLLDLDFLVLATQYLNLIVFCLGKVAGKQLALI